MNNEKFIEFVEDSFKLHDDEESDYVELETWTNGGVNMIITLQKDTDKTYFEQFEEYVGGFDIDEEVMYYRQDEKYCNDFTLRESLDDFSNYEKWLSGIVSYIENYSERVVNLLENYLLMNRLTRTELFNKIVKIFSLREDEVELSELNKGFGELKTDDYFDLILPMSEDEVYTIFVLKTNEKDKYYVTEIGGGF